MEFRSNNLLVTGGAGFIGSNFIKYILDKYKNLKLYNLDLLTYAGDLNNTKHFSANSRYKFIKGDINDKNLIEDIFSDYNIDGIINFAAETHVDNSITNPEIFIKTNINGVFNLLNFANKFWMNKPFKPKKKYAHSRFHQVSTDEVYGSIYTGSFSENSLYRPNSPYSASKASADHIVRSFNKTYGLNSTISICSNNFGLNQNKEKLIPKILYNIKNDISTKIYGDGKNIREWIHVTDHCKAIEQIFNNSKAGEVYNVGSENELSNIELAKLCYKIFDKKQNIEFIKDRAGHDFRYRLNSSKIYRLFGWKAEQSIHDFLKTFR